MQDTFFPQVMPDCSALFQKFCGQLLKIGIIMKAKLMLHFLHYKKTPKNSASCTDFVQTVGL